MRKMKKISLFPSKHRVTAGVCSLGVKLVSAIVLISLSEREPPSSLFSFNESVDPQTFGAFYLKTAALW